VVVKVGRRRKWNVWDAVVIVLIVASSLVYYETTKLRATEGIHTFYSDAEIIAVNSLAWVLLWALVSGYVVSFILRKAKAMNG